MAVRPKGWIKSWNPTGETRVLAERCKAILTQMHDDDLLETSNRKVYYELGVRYGYPKTDPFYDKVNETLTLMRRAGWIPMIGWLHDVGATAPSDWWWKSAEQFRRVVGSMAEQFELDRQRGQRVRQMVWTESAGLIGAANKAAKQYSVPVVSGARQDSLAHKATVAKFILDNSDEKTDRWIIWHIGDYDGQGCNIFDTLAEDLPLLVYDMDPKLTSWPCNGAWPTIELRRLGLVPEHIERFGLEDAQRPPKPKPMDVKYGFCTRKKIGSTWVLDEVLKFCCEADALPLPAVVGMVEEAIQSHMDYDLYRQVLEDENRERLAVTKQQDDSC
jgi:hypothetical protein